MEKYGIELPLKALACHWIPSFEGMTIAGFTWLLINLTTIRRYRHYREGGNPVRASAFSAG